MSYLKDGELKILNALKEEPKKFKEMSKQVIIKSKPIRNPKGILNPSALSTNLKSLQKQGFIEQNIESKSFQVLPLDILLQILKTLCISDAVRIQKS